MEKLLENLAGTLSDHEIPYMVIGGQAVLLYGEPRLTKDIDITLDLEPASFGKVRAVVQSLGLKILVEDAREFVNKTLVLPTIDDKSGFRIDFIFSFSPYEKQAMRRIRSVKMGKEKVNFVSLEDLIIHKIIAGRPRDMEDAASILAKNPGFDKTYVLEWLGEFDRSLNDNFTGKFNEILEKIT